MIIIKEELLEAMKELMLRVKQDATNDYKAGYTDGILDLFNHLDKQMPIKQTLIKEKKKQGE